MGDLVSLEAARDRRDAKVEALFQRYVEAQDRAKATCQLQDGIAAGKAWAEFVRAFEAVSA